MKKVVFWSWGLCFGLASQVQAQLVLNEIYATPPTGEKEWLEIYNPGETPVSLQGWKVAENVNGVMKNQELIDKSEEATLAAKGFWMVENSKITLNNPGDTIYLLGPDETLVEVLTYPKLTSQESYSRLPDGGEIWQISEPSPTLTNYLPEEVGDDEATSGVSQVNQVGRAQTTPPPTKTSKEGQTNDDEKAETDQTKKEEGKDWKAEINFSLPKYIYQEKVGVTPASILIAQAASSSATNSAMMREKKLATQKWLAIGGAAVIIVGLLPLVLLELVPYWKKWDEKKDVVVDF